MVEFTQKENIISGGGLVLDTRHSPRSFLSIDHAIKEMLQEFDVHETACSFDVLRKLNGGIKITMYTRGMTIIKQLESKK